MAAVVVNRSPGALSSVPKMIVKTPLILDNDLQKLISNSKVLVVGAGGIGCELLKNLVLSGFEDIEVIDMDTIEVSNLNRQFLFQKKHVGQPKAKVACESVRQFNPKVKLVPHHASVLSSEFGVGYIEKFNVVLNALDNKTARSHVNRLCLAAGVPLVESGSAGYIGQVELISKNRTQCYECDPKPAAKTYPGCTIRNTPSELIHCIVWAKHLFNQLFGLHDPTEEDEDVSPDPTDVAAGGNSDNSVPKISTREWAKHIGYESQALFKKLFEDDINYLLSLKRLWETRRPPVPLDWNKAKLLNEEQSPEGNRITEPRIPSQKVWTISECADIFAASLKALKESMEKSPDGYLTWDKDVKPAMDFVAAAANIRAHIFGIELKSRFEIKSMAGNIVPAIATSNAIIAGLVVLNAMNILRGELAQCQSVYLRDAPNGRGAVIVRERNLTEPNPNCTVCSEKPQVVIATDLSKMKCKEFESGVLKNTLNMIAPDVQLDSTGDIFISSEEGETEHNNDKTLEDIGIRDGTILQADDFLQNYKLTIIVKQRELGRDDPPFIVTSDISTLKPKEEKKEEKSKTTENGNDGDKMNSKSSKSSNIDDECFIIFDAEPIMILNDEDEEPRKRKQEEIPVPVKKRRTDQGQSSSESDVI